MKVAPAPPKEQSLKSQDGRFIQSTLIKRRKKLQASQNIDYGKRNMATQIGNIGAS